MKEREICRNQKLKILYLMRILLENTDEDHSITMQEIQSKLAAYDISAERKGLYTDIEQLRRFGLDIVGEQKNRTYYYRVVSRDFELAELKLLVDSVQSAKFITTRKSNQLIKKLEGLASRHEAGKLHRQVYVAGRVKTMNESILINVDAVHQAISDNVMIEFSYFEWTPDKQMRLRHDGAVYQVSPWALCWDNEYYYMVAFDSKSQMIKHYRVDKMLKIKITDKQRMGKEHFGSFDMAVYTNKRFGMYDGKEEMVRLSCENRLAGVMIDRFGSGVYMRSVDESHFEIEAKVAVSEQFYGWIMGLGTGVRIIAPDYVVNGMKNELKKQLEQY